MEGAIFSVPSLNNPLVGVDPEVAKPGVPAKPKVAGCKGCEVLSLYLVEEA